MIAALTALTFFGGIGVVQANGLGEDKAWGFKSSGDTANQAVVQDLIRRQQEGYYDQWRNPRVTSLTNIWSNSGNTTNTTNCGGTGDQGCGALPGAVGFNAGLTTQNQTVGNSLTVGPQATVGAPLSQSNAGAQNSAVAGQ
jgi:hypothetical protein